MAGKRSRVVHRTRPEVSSRLAMLVTVRIREGLPSLRKREAFGVLENAFVKGKERLGLRLLHFSVLSNHMHFLVEARDRHALTLGIQGLSIRIAKGLNRFWGRKGKVFADRFHSSLLRTQAEIRRGLRYVLQNAKKHGLPIGKDRVDPFSSGPWYLAWRKRRRPKICPVVEAWGGAGHFETILSIGLDELPGPGHPFT